MYFNKIYILFNNSILLLIFKVKFSENMKIYFNILFAIIHFHVLLIIISQLFINILN